MLAGLIVCRANPTDIHAQTLWCTREEPQYVFACLQAQDPQLMGGKRLPDLGLGCSCAACSRHTARPVLTPKCPAFCPDPNTILLRGETNFLINK